jgi:ATP-dependent exoDNAse (exonuclease V) beta subunit
VGNTINPAQFLIPEDILACGTPLERPSAHEEPQAHQKIKAFVSDPWGGLQEEFLNQEPRSAILAQKGEFYHAVLMHISHVHEANVTQVLQKAWDKATRLLPRPGGNPEILEDIRNFINREDVRPFFYLPHDVHVLCEKEFVNTYGDTRRIDRLIVFEDKVWIVDYKLSPGAEEENQKQINQYIVLVQQFYPKHKVSGHVMYLIKE